MADADIEAPSAIGNGDPILDAEQQDRFDRLIDNGGFNRTEALMMVGALPVKQEITDEEKSDARLGPQNSINGHAPTKEEVNRQSVRQGGTRSRKGLGPTGQRIADRDPSRYPEYKDNDTAA